MAKTLTLLFVFALFGSGICLGDEERPAINPFGNRPTQRDDAIPGCVELSDGSILVGQVYLTRDARLQVYDETVKRQREIPLRVVQRIDGSVKKEWLEKEWRFKENANNVKVYTGRTYPARECVYTITLKDGRKIVGPLSALFYVQGEQDRQGKKYILHKRQKGPIESDLESLVYVSSLQLGEEAFATGKQRIEQQQKDTTN
jgi:hypothetical protein